MKSRLIALLLLLLVGAASAFSMDVTAKSAIIIDAGSGKVLWQRNADSSMYPASTTKIMTGLLLLENCMPSDIITAPADVTKVKESSMHLKPLEKVSAKDMLYALMLRSANDGCYAVAVHIAGSVPAFAKMMNDRAKEIGCTNTHFHNPNGLNDPLHTTTAHDLALIARSAMTYEPFREVVKTQKYTINRSINWKDTHMVNRDKLLAKDPSAEGIKTGYTIPAGHCFVGGYTRNGYRIITVVMKSANWQKDTQQMVDWAYANYEKQDVFKAGDLLGQVEVAGHQVPALAKQDGYVLARKGDIVSKELTVTVSGPIEKGQEIGLLVARGSDGSEQTFPPLAGESVASSTGIGAIRGPFSALGMLIGSLLLIAAFVVRSRARRMAYASTIR
jgi:D-alanyl-D-alanine carboxypeptidase